MEVGVETCWGNWIINNQPSDAIVANEADDANEANLANKADASNKTNESNEAIATNNAALDAAAYSLPIWFFFFFFSQICRM